MEFCQQFVKAQCAPDEKYSEGCVIDHFMVLRIDAGSVMGEDVGEISEVGRDEWNIGEKDIDEGDRKSEAIEENEIRTRHT